MTERYTNLALTTLTSALDGSQTTVSVDDAEAFPSNGNFRITVDTEIMLVTAVSGNNFTVTRGAETSTATTHALGAAVGHVLTGGAIDQILAERVQTGADASKPSPVHAGALYLSNNSPFLYRDTGTALSAFVPMVPVTPPVLGDFTWTNQNGSTAVSSHGGMFMQQSVQGGTNLSFFGVPIPTAPYTVTAGYYAIGGTEGGFGLVGLTITDGTKLIMLRYGGTDSGSISLIVQQFTNITTDAANTPLNVTYGGGRGVGGALWARLTDDGTNRKYWVGIDPNNFLLAYTEASGTYLTPTEIGMCLNPYSASVMMHVIHWSGA